ncbi:MAG TPA: hypothetical protein ENJ69_03870, partial [Bacteroidetes bacterium]|nr:hypothetical protein [Bacteroidota bacterium]
MVAEPNVYPPLLVSLLFVLYAFLILYAAVAVYFLYEKLKQKGSGPYPFLFFLFVLFLFRMLLLWLGFPAFFDASFWTTTKITHLAGFVSPGDLLIDFLLFCFVLWVFFQYLAGCTGKWTRSVWLRLAAVQPWVFLLPVLLYVITERILQNSGLMLYPENVYFSMTGVIRLSLMLVVNLFIYLWVGAFVSFFRTKGVSFRQQVFSLLGVALLFFLIPGLEKTVILLSCFVTLVLMSVFWFSERTKRPYFHSILSILVLSLSAAYLLNANELENRNAHQQFTANMLTQKRDPYLQYLLKSRAREILRDATIIQIIRSGHSDKEREIARYLNKNYFHGLLSAYRKQVTLCAPGQQLEIQPDNKVVGCDAFFRELKGETVDTLSGFELSLVNNTSESIYYLARFRYLPGTAGNEPVNLYVEFYTNIIPKGLGYPELLQNAETGDLHLSGYSFAFYQNRKLEYKFGDYLFPIDFSGFRSEPERMFFRKDGFIHYILPVSKTETLIVSRPGWKVSDWLLPFSLLFILSGILLLVYVFFSYGKQIRETFSYSFSTRLQLTIFSAMMLVYVLLTVVIIYYFNFNNRQTISNNLKEKTHSVMIELQHKLASYGNNVMQNKMEIQSYLQKFSMVFFSDINLYDNSGWLIVSSRPEIFSRGLQSRLINPGAYREIEKEHKLFYLGKERIKQVTFYSSYAPFILESGEAAGIINLPYFARQSELQHTYFQMLA